MVRLVPVDLDQGDPQQRSFYVSQLLVVITTTPLWTDAVEFIRASNQAGEELRDCWARAVLAVETLRFMWVEQGERDGGLLRGLASRQWPIDLGFWDQAEGEEDPLYAATLLFLDDAVRNLRELGDVMDSLVAYEERNRLYAAANAVMQWDYDEAEAARDFGVPRLILDEELERRRWNDRERDRVTTFADAYNLLVHLDVMR